MTRKGSNVFKNQSIKLYTFSGKNMVKKALSFVRLSATSGARGPDINMIRTFCNYKISAIDGKSIELNVYNSFKRILFL